MERPPSLFDRLISHPRRPRVTLGLGLLFMLAAFVCVCLDGAPGEFLSSGQWRGVLQSPILILYILIVGPPLGRMADSVVRSFRPAVLVDDDSFDRLVREAAYVKPGSEIVAFGAGALFGLLGATWASGGSVSWLGLYLIASDALMFGLLAWTIYVSVASSRLTTALLRQPLRVNPFELGAFEAIGRESLLVALVFVGGITLSLLFSAFQPWTFRLLEFWIVYIPLALVPVFVFFLNMYPTHRVLASVKKRELAAVGQQLQQSGKALVQRLEENQATGALGADISALIAYEQRLQAARTWPYNTTMLRALAISVLIPFGTVLVRFVVERLFG